jgi:hypothetical protein
VHGVYIDIHKLQLINFPINTDSLGSAIVYINECKKNVPIVIGVLSKGNECQLLEENQFSLSRKTATGSVNIIGKGDTGELFVQVISDQATGGNIYVDVLNANKDSVVNLNVKGAVNVYASDQVNIDAENSINLGSENLNPGVLGTELKNFLSDFIDEVANITVTTAIGIQPILNIVQIENFKNRLDSLLSTLNNLE